MPYRVLFTRQGEKSVGKLSSGLLKRVRIKILSLADDLRPSGCQQLKGGSQLRRVRVGDYRIVYSIDDDEQCVEIALVAHRREVYGDV